MPSAEAPAFCPDPSTKRCSTCKKRKPPEHFDGRATCNVCRPKKRKQFLSTEETKRVALEKLKLAQSDQHVLIIQLQALVKNQSAIITNQQNELLRLTQNGPIVPAPSPRPQKQAKIAPVEPGPKVQHQSSGIQIAPRHPQIGYAVPRPTAPPGRAMLTESTQAGAGHKIAERQDKYPTQRQPERCTESHPLISAQLQRQQWAERQDRHSTQRQPERCTASPQLTSAQLQLQQWAERQDRYSTQRQPERCTASPQLTSAELQLQTACLQLQEIRNQEEISLHTLTPSVHKPDPKVEKFHRTALVDPHVPDYQQVPDVTAMNSTGEQVKAYLAHRLVSLLCCCYPLHLFTVSLPPNVTVAGCSGGQADAKRFVCTGSIGFPFSSRSSIPSSVE